MASANIKLGYKTAAWFTANDTLVLKVGQIVYLEQTGIYKLGDGVTQLSALAFLGGNGLAYTPEDVANKSTSVNTDQASNTKYPSVKAVYDWAIGLFLKKGTITNNTILKGSGTDTATDSNITDDGTKVTVNGGFYATTGASEIFVFGDTANITADGQTNTNIETNLTENNLRHNVKNTFDAPANYFPYLTASQIVETDASKNLVSAAKGTAYNKNFGTTAGTVLEGNRITQTITNGVTDKVPSEDAVYDALALKLTQNNFTDITGSCTINGWISFSVNKIKAIDMGNYYIVNGQVVGTSNSSITQVVLPFTNNGVQLDDCRFAINNGTNIFARCFVGVGSNTVDFRATVAGSLFTSFGTKAIYFTVIIEK